MTNSKGCQHSVYRWTFIHQESITKILDGLHAYEKPSSVLLQTLASKQSAILSLTQHTCIYQIYALIHSHRHVWTHMQARLAGFESLSMLMHNAKMWFELDNRKMCITPLTPWLSSVRPGHALQRFFLLFFCLLLIRMQRLCSTVQTARPLDYSAAETMHCTFNLDKTVADSGV